MKVVRLCVGVFRYGFTALAVAVCFSIVPQVRAQVPPGADVSAPGTQSQHHAPHRKHRKERVMEISFVRSGGFAGRATNVAGTVRVDSNGTHVTAPGTDYHRELTPDEAKQLQDLAGGKLAADAAPAPSPVRDGFQYELSVKRENGKTHSLVLAPHAQGASPEGGPSTLSDWVQRETQRIWEHRLASVPK